MSIELQNTEQPAAGGQTRLLDEFPASTYEDWREAAVKLLKGAPFDKKFLTKTYEGITLQPIYMQQDVEELPHTDALPGFPPYVRGTNALGYKHKSWEVAQEIPFKTPEEFNKALKYDLERGQTVIPLLLDGATQLATLEDLEKALEGIHLENIPILVQPGATALPFVALLAALVQKRKQSLKNICGDVAMDPLGMLVCEGTLPFSLKTAYDMMATLTDWTQQYAPRLKTIAVQGHLYHNSGGCAVQELAFVIATAVEYLREMMDRGLAIDAVASHIQFVFSIGTTYFMEIAKLRAARIVWAKVVKAFGGNEHSQKMTMHVRTSFWNKTILDPYVNMLRTTVEAFAGVIGGCDSIHVGCFDEPIRLPDEFSRRIARNTQSILKEETHLNEVIDPAGGSWYVETLTDEVARKAWRLFQEVEQKGGMIKALELGFPQGQIARTASQRITNFSTRKDILVGTNMYPNLKEKPLEPHTENNSPLEGGQGGVSPLEGGQGGAFPCEGGRKGAFPSWEKSGVGYPIETFIQAALDGASFSDMLKAVCKTEEPTPKIEPVRIYRGAEIFEALRAAVEAYKAKTGARPKVFLANMGPISQHKARADFSIGFFEVGGFEMLTNDGFQTVEEAANAAVASEASVVVICSTDETYSQIVPPLTQTIKKARPETTVILTGYPKDHIEAFKEAGVDEFIHLRANLYEILVNLMKKIGVQDLFC
jgi:methylmalonyl-CoA mutase